MTADEWCGDTVGPSQSRATSADEYERLARLTKAPVDRRIPVAPWSQSRRAVLELTMPPGLPQRPPLAMRFWLFRRSKGNGMGSATAAHGQSSGYAMSIESLEHMVRSRVRTFLRHTWLVTILGTIVLVAAVWAGFYFTTQADHMRIAAGPVDAKFVQALTNQIAKGHHNLSSADRSDAGIGGDRSGDQQGSGRSRGAAEQSRRLGELAGDRHCAAERDGADRSAARRRRQTQRRPESRCGRSERQGSKAAERRRQAKAPRAPRAPRAQRTPTATIATRATTAATATSSAKSGSLPASASASSPAMRRRPACSNSC